MAKKAAEIFAGLKTVYLRNGNFEKTRQSRRDLLHPIGDENIRLVRGFSVAVGSPDEALAVGGKHWESVEIGVIGDAAETCAILVDQVEIEPAGILLVLQV